MDFELNEDQQAILESVDRLLAQHAGPARAIELNRQDSYDSDLHRLLDESGFSTIARDLARDGIRVMTIAPGIFSTPMMDLSWVI